MKIDELTKKLDAVKIVYGNVNVFVTVPGIDGFTTPYIDVCGGIVKHNDTGMAGIVISGYRTMDVR
jgi:hypothetical protein